MCCHDMFVDCMSKEVHVKKVACKKCAFVILPLVLMLLVFTACGKSEVTWLDADGTLLYVESVSKDQTIPSKDLPADSDQWHYTEWKQVISGKNSITFFANRVEKNYVVWLDGDGSILYEEYALDGNVSPKELPNDTEQWHYTGWKQTTSGKSITYVAERIEKAHVVWLDGDGNILHEEYVLEADISTQPIPKDTNQWHYTGWKQTTFGHNITYVPERTEKAHIVWLDGDGTILHEEYALETDFSAQPLPKDTNQWHYTSWKQTTSGKSITYLAERIEKVHVVWLDGNGVLLYEEYVLETAIPTKTLPKDTNQWHYTGWKQTVSGKSITYIAERIEKFHVTWLDSDGSKLYEEYALDANISSKALPKDTAKWHYTGWSKTQDKNQYTFIAERELRRDYFVGNVFQIVIKDLAGMPLGTGTGFVFNQSGWFITNAHVMENAYQAVAIFEIKDPVTGESFTTLEINQGSYVHYDKDIFIGKLEGYGKIAKYYNAIPFQSAHSIGDVTYSVGYPNSSVSMEIHKGQIEKDLSSLYDKLYSGITYIASSSFIAPGSSGGILINENAEVIGMTTLGWFDANDKFLLGAAIEAYNYTQLTDKVNTTNLQDIALLLHPDEEPFIRFFRDFSRWTNTQKIDMGGTLYYECKWEKEGVNDDGWAYYYEEYLTVYADGFISYSFNIYWDNGDHRERELYGYYSSSQGLDNLKYYHKYTWGETGSWCIIESDNINYSENISLTLRNHTSSSSNGKAVTESHIEYAKEGFNSAYKWLYDLIFTEE